MKKLQLFGLLAMTLVLALGMALIACNSDSDDNTVPAGEGEFTIEGTVDGRDVVAMLTKSGRAAYQIATGDRYVITFKDTGDEISKGSIEYNNPPSVRFVPDDGTDAFYGYFTGTMLTIYGVPYDGKTYTLGGGTVGPAPAPSATGLLPDGVQFVFPDKIKVTFGSNMVLGPNSFFVSNGTGKATYIGVDSTTVTATNYELLLENVVTGIVNLKIVAPGFYSGNIPVLVYEAGVTPYVISGVVADGTAYRDNTTKLTITTSAAIAGLTADDIVIVGLTGAAKKVGALAGTAPAYELTVEDVSAGVIGVYILKDKVYSNAMPVVVNDDTPRTYTVVAVGESASKPLPSYQLIFRFSDDSLGASPSFSGLFKAIVPGTGDCATLSGSLVQDTTDTTGRTYTYALGDVSPGTITVQAQDKATSGIDDKAQTVTLAIEAGVTLPNTVTAMSVSTACNGTTAAFSALTGYNPATLASTPAYYAQSVMDTFVSVGNIVFTPAAANVGTSSAPTIGTPSYGSGDGIASTSTPWIYNIGLSGGTQATGDKLSFDAFIRNPGVFMPRKVSFTYTWP